MTNSRNYGVFHDGYIVSPASFRQLHLTMSPFQTEDVFINRQLWKDRNRVVKREVLINGCLGQITRSATDALALALNQLNLKADDEIWIETTSNNRYISSCVTATIERFCKWSRCRSNHTVAILVNHEFGFVYPRMAELKSLGFPIIEDAAYSMFSAGNDGDVGSWGDYVLYSMAKMFPIQAGGILLSKRGELAENDISEDEESYFNHCFHYYARQQDAIIQKRRQNHDLLKSLFESIGMTSRFHPMQHEVPGAFLFKAPEKNLDGLKVFLQAQGIECSVFYGEEVFFVPCHQRMNDTHMHYLVDLVSWYFRNYQ